MKPDRVLANMIVSSGIPADEVSRRLGHSRSWASVSIRPGRDPKLSTVAAVAAVTGHEVAILDAESGDVVATITTPEVHKDHEGEGEGEDA